MIYVIGSGHAGVSCAYGLLKRGLKVTMLDAGVEIEPEIKAQIECYKKTRKYEDFPRTTDAVSKKLRKVKYGSEFVFSEVKESFPICSDENVSCDVSFAQGGLSNIWGSVWREYKNKDFASWPFDAPILAPYYKEVEQFVPISAAIEDGKSSCFNLHKISNQTQYLMNHWKKKQCSLDSKGITADLSILAVNFERKFSEEQCSYCGLCQYGCPEDLIYSSRHTLQELVKNPGFFYIPNVVVDSFRESEDFVSLFAHDRITQEQVCYKAARVFVACGALLSTRLVLSSLEKYDKTVSMLDSQHFVVPALLSKRFKGVEEEWLHTLAQANLILNVEPLNFPAHLQLYTYMRHFQDEFSSRLGKKLYKHLKFAARPFLERMVVFQCFLHSDDSQKIGIRLQKGKPDIFSLHGVTNPRSIDNIRAIQRALSHNRGDLGFSPLKLLSKISNIGRSFHFGGSFPMRKNSSQSMETNSLGVLNGLNKVHLVDASIFPSIQAGPIAPTIMANALRIAMEAEI